VSGRQVAVVVAAMAIALTLQASLFPYLAVAGVVPNLCLLVVVATALSRGEEAGMLVGFAAGLALDLAPPADHLAGRWALALVVVGYVAGRVRRDGAPDTVSMLWTVAVCSVVGTSVFALSGLLLGDLGVGIPGLLQVILVAAVWDVALALLIVPPLRRVLAPAGEPERVAAL
jgi:rod shape-determining protein MreD